MFFPNNHGTVAQEQNRANFLQPDKNNQAKRRKIQEDLTPFQTLTLVAEQMLTSSNPQSVCEQPNKHKINVDRHMTTVNLKKRDTSEMESCRAIANILSSKKSAVNLSNIKNPFKLLQILFNDYRKEVDAAIMKALQDTHLNISTDFTICQVPGMGNGLRATKEIIERSIIGGLLNGVLTTETEIDDSGDPVSPAYWFKIEVEINNKLEAMTLDGNTPVIKDPANNFDKLKKACTAGLGTQSSILQLINYSHEDTANVTMQMLTVKCQGITLKVPMIVAKRHIVPGEELRMNYGTRYFSISTFYFFQTFRKLCSGKTIDTKKLWKLYDIAEKYCTLNTSYLVKMLKENHKKAIIETLRGESKSLLKEWEKEFFETVDILSKRRAKYLQISNDVAMIQGPQNWANAPAARKQIESTVKKSAVFEKLLKHDSFSQCNYVYTKLTNTNFTVHKLHTLKYLMLPSLDDKNIEHITKAIIFFLFSDIEPDTKNEILIKLAKILENTLQKTQDQDALMQHVNTINSTIRKEVGNVTLLYLITWLADDPHFAEKMMILYERHLPDSFTRIVNGNNLIEYAEMNGNGMTKSLIETIQARIHLE